MSASIHDIGSYSTAEHYAVVGQPTSFYVWGRTQLDQRYHTCLSGWITGDLNLYQKLKQLRNTDRNAFKMLVEKLKKDYPYQ